VNGSGFISTDDADTAVAISASSRSFSSSEEWNGEIEASSLPDSSSSSSSWKAKGSSRGEGGGVVVGGRVCCVFVVEGALRRLLGMEMEEADEEGEAEEGRGGRLRRSTGNGGRGGRYTTMDNRGACVDHPGV